MTNTRQQAAIYLRISSDPGESALGVARQRQDALALAASHGLDVPPHLIFIDNDITAKGTKVRPDFIRMKRAIEKDGVRAIICYKLPRLSRNATDTAWLDTMGEKHGLVIMETSGTSYRLDDSSNSLNFGMLMVVAAHQSKVTSELVRRKNQATREAGMPAGGRRSFGYEKATLKGMKIIDHEAEALRWAYGAVIDGISLHAMARHWNDHKITTATGIEWTASKVSRILRNKRNVGVLVHDGREIGLGAWEPIVDDSTFYRAQMILNDPKRLGKGGPQRLLSGVAICGIDGCGAKVNIRKSTTKSGVYYGCKVQPHLTRMAEPVENLVVGMVLARLAEPDAADHLRPSQDDSELSDLFARRRQLDDDLDRLPRLLRQGIFTEASVMRESQQIQAEIAEINASIDSMTPGQMSSQIDALISAEDIRAQWETYDVATQRLIISTFADVVILPSLPNASRRFDPSRVIVDFKTM